MTLGKGNASGVTVHVMSCTCLRQQNFAHRIVDNSLNILDVHVDHFIHSLADKSHLIGHKPARKVSIKWESPKIFIGAVLLLDVNHDYYCTY